MHFTWQYNILLDPRGETDLRYRCKHVNFVENTHFACEREFLFSPYSVFDVEAVEWSDNCNYMQPHKITLRCAAPGGVGILGVAGRMKAESDLLVERAVANCRYPFGPASL